MLFTVAESVVLHSQFFFFLSPFHGSNMQFPDLYRMCVHTKNWVLNLINGLAFEEKVSVSFGGKSKCTLFAVLSLYLMCKLICDLRY